METNTIIILSFMFGHLIGVIYCYFVVKHIAKRRGVWNILNAKVKRD